MEQLLSPQDAKLVQRLRAGDEEAFIELIRELNPSLLRVARMFVPTLALAEDVVQETWLAVLNGIDRFEGRSSLKTWIFRILTNTAKTRGERERRSVPFSTLDPEEGGFEPAVERSRFTGTGHWAVLPRAWPEDRLLANETRSMIERAIERLPPSQRTVITLRDVEGWTADEVRNALELSETNQRVLLHRARAKVRGALEQYLSEEQ
ncbi:MAG TPA: sigma-70 family RNA polymerase sigma factor [Gaiellaceae bacterium]